MNGGIAITGPRFNGAAKTEAENFFFLLHIVGKAVIGFVWEYYYNIYSYL